MKLFRINSIGSALRALVGWPLFIVGLYMLAALTGSMIPANADWRPEAGGGVEIFVETNGVHVSLIVPMSAAGEDLSDLIQPRHLDDPMLFGTHAMIGWGHGGVYRNAQTWADVRTADIFSAIAGSSDTVLHVYHRINPQPASYIKPVRVSVAQYRHMIRDIRAAFRLDADGKAIAAKAYGPDNLFYTATGRYTAFNTCNEWTGRILRRAGVRIGIWTPMPGGVMRWF